MRRLAIHFSDDILLSEIIEMAKAHGFNVRHVNGLTVVDRVPNYVRKEVHQVVRIATGLRSVKP